jgi:hypothetical protein
MLKRNQVSQSKDHQKHSQTANLAMQKPMDESRESEGSTHPWDLFE